MTDPNQPSDGHEFAPLIGQQSADRCSSCGADMAPDQRYCVECGNRRGRARFSLGGAPAAAPVAAAAAPSRMSSVSSSANFLLMLVLLLLAVGVGVLIGGNNNSAPVSSAKPITVNVGSGGGAASTTATTGTTPSGGSGGSAGSGSSSKAAANQPVPHHHVKETGAEKTAVAKSSQKLKKAGISTAPISKKTSAAINKKVRQVLGNSGKNLASATTQVGDPCTKGTAGCSLVNGHYIYTGNVF